MAPVRYGRNGRVEVFAPPLGASASSEAASRLVVKIQSIISTNKSPLDVANTAACDLNPRFVATVQVSVEHAPYVNELLGNKHLHMAYEVDYSNGLILYLCRK